MRYAVVKAALDECYQGDVEMMRNEFHVFILSEYCFKLRDDPNTPAYWLGMYILWRAFSYHLSKRGLTISRNQTIKYAKEDGRNLLMDYAGLVDDLRREMAEVRKAM